MFLTAIKDTFAQIGDANKGYNIYVNQKIRERERTEDNKIGSYAAKKFLAHLMKNCHNMPDDQKWKEVSYMWDIGNMSNDEFNNMVAWRFQQDWYETVITDGYEDGWIDIKGTKGTKENPEYIAVQCKKWRFDPIWENEIAKFYGKPKTQEAIKHWSQLIFITSSYFTQRAYELAEKYNIYLEDYMWVMDAYEAYQKSHH